MVELGLIATGRTRVPTLHFCLLRDLWDGRTRVLQPLLGVTCRGGVFGPQVSGVAGHPDYLHGSHRVL